ncbi:uncharacterized protein BJ171DRAFT_511974 [Polychytrium aggregatum]|uniref:uncharacterized protein n=1 Tax=Polychytrium aggregatum TaxID=110093 RepID=UPI0022FF093C|nr:uncharacterized protein BJ171DRAFT_511974 [Polychytrium aggregatum]KAI9202796.1 hypothetical protein BJ171DRAFT_511974 [Polychytrium aggregatum]
MPSHRPLPRMAVCGIRTFVLQGLAWNVKQLAIGRVQGVDLEELAHDSSCQIVIVGANEHGPVSYHGRVCLDRALLALLEHLFVLAVLRMPAGLGLIIVAVTRLKDACRRSPLLLQGRRSDRSDAARDLFRGNRLFPQRQFKRSLTRLAAAGPCAW